MTSTSFSPAEWYLCLTRTSMSSIGSTAASLDTMYIRVDTSLAQFSQIDTVWFSDLMWISRMADASCPHDIPSSGNSYGVSQNVS